MNVVIISEYKMEVEMATEKPKPVIKPPRRPDVDLMRIILTWSILLFHITVAYTPKEEYYIKSFGWSLGADYVSYFWIIFQDIWQMPMFFFLSGVSAYFALFRRTQRQFREERTHRLFVPWLVLCLLNGLYSVTWFAPLTPNCEAAYYGSEINSTVGTSTWSWCETFWTATENTTFTKVICIF